MLRRVMGGWLIGAVMAVLVISGARAAENPHEKTVREFFKLTNFQQSYERSVEMIIEGQIKGNPALTQFRPVFTEFFAKFLSWEAVEPQLVKLYADAFTDEELKDLIAFYASPTGKKWATTQPDLAIKGAHLQQDTVKAHMSDLQQMIAAQAQKLKAEGGADEKPQTQPEK